MPLSDWMGGSRHDGFARHLNILAAGLRLEGEISCDRGFFTVYARGVGYTVLVFCDEGDPVVHAFSNVRFPPDALPPQVAEALARWPLSRRYMAWDGISLTGFSCFYLLGRIAPDNFTAPILRRTLDDMVAEVASMDRALKESGYDRLTVRATPRASPAGQPPQPLLQKVTRAISYLLDGPRRGG